MICVAMVSQSLQLRLMERSCQRRIEAFLDDGDVRDTVPRESSIYVCAGRSGK
jgi:hypothetical protein